MTTRETADAQITVQGEVGPHTVEYVRTKIGALARYADHSIVHARVRITEHADRVTSRAFLAQANLSVGRQPVRAQVAAASLGEAIDGMCDRLRRQLIAHARHWEARRGGVALPDEWRHASEPAHRPGHFPRPQAEREIVRRKTVALPLSTVDEAAFDMQMLDYQFHLFTEAGTGQDSVLYRAEGGELRLAQLQPASGRITAGSAGSAEAAGAAGFAVSPQPAPALTVGEATQRLDLSGLPFVFFEEIGQGVAGGRGAVLYRRYDGHYGLISPA